MAVYGNIGPFVEKSEHFEDYCDRMDAFMKVNEIKKESQTSLFLASVGPDTYRVLKNICSPDSASSKSYEELKVLLKDHLDPKPIVIAERHKFWTASQDEDESVGNFIVRLKTLAFNCAFDNFLKDALRDLGFWVEPKDDNNSKTFVSGKGSNI
jgi:hypothetical protein